MILYRYLLIIFVTLEHFSVKESFCTIPVYGTQKKMPWSESNHCQKYATEHFSVKAIFCTVPVYGTQKKLPWRESNHCQNTRHFMGFKKKIAYGMDRTTVKKFFMLSCAYQLSRSVHHASADIYNQYQHSPINEFQLFLLFFFICFFF